ncbi:hypothetical protein ABMA46_06100 [Mesorhizobium sp. CN5-321]|jgi:hypothetical protein|uniref:hypothetical protein n=1 Tax=Mesorhizobium hunchu TaxID=3157708 RepID=UPI0032B746A6
MIRTRDFMTVLLARFKAVHAAELKSARPAPKALATGKPRAMRQVPAYKPKPPTYRPASNM